MAGRTRCAVPVVGLGVLLVGALLFKSIFFSAHLGHISPPPVGFYTDATITAALIDGVANYPDAGAQIGKSASGGPDLYVKNHVAFVGTLDPSKADSLCSTIAGMYDPNTGWALPLTGAIVVSGGKSVAICGRDAGWPPAAGGPNG
jgi:hypothetical protein